MPSSNERVAMAESRKRSWSRPVNIFAIGASNRGGDLDLIFDDLKRGEPLFQAVVKAVLRVPSLKIENTQHQRAGEAKQRRAECRTHTGERTLQVALEVIENEVEVSTLGRQAGNDLTDPGYRVEQPPKGAQQAKEDQQADHIARDVARFVEP